MVVDDEQCWSQRAEGRVGASSFNMTTHDQSYCNISFQLSTSFISRPDKEVELCTFSLAPDQFPFAPQIKPPEGPVLTLCKPLTSEPDVMKCDVPSVVPKKPIFPVLH
ncbi:unnamed protein product [Pleuronectes platessa]|uniref:Uncharacterized protein n=1 Tax=Pleuronectes platessa TaxID=8262 RepID=A0A9N7YNU6_PLEPL|nr:unnamed protein product [Pleuronectes platessa]